MDIQQELIDVVDQAVARGDSLDVIADHLSATYPNSSLIEFAVALQRAMPHLDRRRVSDPLAKPKATAAMLVKKRPEKATPSNIAITLRDPKLYPDLTATQMGEVLKADGVFPQINEAHMRQALQDSRYSSAEIDAAIQALFPQQPLAAWAGTYQAWIGYGGGSGYITWESPWAVVITAAGQLRVADRTLINVTVTDSVASWEWTGNECRGSIVLKQHDQPGYYWSHPVDGPCFTGAIQLNDGQGAYDFRGVRTGSA